MTFSTSKSLRISNVKAGVKMEARRGPELKGHMLLGIVVGKKVFGM
jgi:hypothetical protein